MQQVAADAGVSLKTVSRVVNGEPGVSRELARRVTASVERLGYRHNFAASNLRRGQRTASIGVLLQDVGNAYCSELLRVVEDTSRERGVVVMAASLDEDPERERALVSAFISRRIDGLVLMPTGADLDYLRPDLKAGLPVVLVDRRSADGSIDSVCADNAGGAREAVAHLIAHGHSRIAFLGDAEGISTAVERRDGYRAAMVEAGLGARPEWERLGVRDEDRAAVVTAEMLDGPEPPTAIFAGRNVISLGAARELGRRGQADRVALVGFDDFPSADLIRPALTVVQQDVRGAGGAAIDLLLARLDGDDGPPRVEVLPTRLIPRGSGEIKGCADL